MGAKIPRSTIVKTNGLTKPFFYFLGKNKVRIFIFSTFLTYIF